MNISRVLNNDEPINELELYDKYLKICRDYYAKAQYMSKIENLNEYEISEKLF